MAHTQARGYWRSIEDFISKSSHQREIVESILQGEANKYSFDSKDIVLQVGTCSGKCIYTCTCMYRCICSVYTLCIVFVCMIGSMYDAFVSIRFLRLCVRSMSS